MAERKLILGVDGGGTKTVARIAAVAGDGEISMLGEGLGGPSNAVAVGNERATVNLGNAVDAAHRAAGTEDETIACAVIALAGAGLPEVQSFITGWANEHNLAQQTVVVHDLDPVLAAGLPEGYGIALIAGTGSSVVGQKENGERCETGGWGYWIGDEGSGFDLGRRALGAVADAADGVGPDTVLAGSIMERLQLDNSRDIPQVLASVADTRHTIASLASLLLEAAEAGDAAATESLRAAVGGIARQVLAASRRLQLDATAPLAVAGGVVCSSEHYRQVLLAQLDELGMCPDTVNIVAEPVEGSLIMACDRLLAIPPI